MAASNSAQKDTVIAVILQNSYLLYESSHYLKDGSILTKLVLEMSRITEL